VTHTLIKLIKGHLSNARKDVAVCQGFFSQIISGSNLHVSKQEHVVLFINFSVSASHSVDVPNEIFRTSPTTLGSSRD
jgi:hypothetical protein